MVFNVSGNLKEGEKVAPGAGADAEAHWETGSTEAMVQRKTRSRKSNTCCIVVPWVLVFFCLLMMGGIGNWGWAEHNKLKLVLQKLSDDVVVDKSASPMQSDDAIPVGDANPVLPILQAPDETEVIEVEEEIDITEIKLPNPAPCGPQIVGTFPINFPPPPKDFLESIDADGFADTPALLPDGQFLPFDSSIVLDLPVPIEPDMGAVPVDAVKKTPE